MDNVGIDHFAENPKGRCIPLYIKKNLPDLYKILEGIEGSTWAERIYKYYGGVQRGCVVCGSPTKFKSLSEGYARTCSHKCAMKDPQRALKIKQTCIERYGVENPSQSDEIKKKKEQTCMENYGVRSGLCNRTKIKQTCIERYGVENPSQSDEIKKKKEQTCMENYGVRSGFCLRDKINKTKQLRYNDPNYNNRAQAKQTMQERYGVDNTSQIQQMREYITDKLRENSKLHHPHIVGYTQDGGWICKCPHPDCTQCESRTYETECMIYKSRDNRGTEQCTKLQPIGKYSKNTYIERFIKEILDEYNIEYIQGDRTILARRELDFYLPSYNLAIECNGILWHSDKYKECNNYHHIKYRDCKNQNIQLLTIWEDQIINYPDKIKALIVAKLKIFNKRIMARKCLIKPCTLQESKHILCNHLQGVGQASVRIGLYYNDEIVSVMTFQKGRGCYGGQNKSWELVRYCVKPGYQVVGGASRILKYFIRQYQPQQVISFSSNDISTGQLYKELGFVYAGETDSYWYINKKMQRFHRYNFRKSELVKNGADPNKTEREITKEMGLYKIWDAGQTKWILTTKGLN